MTKRRTHPIFARCYTRVSQSMNDAGAAAHRAELLKGLAGQVLEVGAGTGLNFAHYPPPVTHVTAVEPEPYLRARAEEAGREAAARVDVVEGTAEDIPFDNDTFDAVVISLVLCSVSDQGSALGEISRVLGADGELRFYEHVVAESSRVARLQRLADRTVYPFLSGGCHMSRDTHAAIIAAGFDVTAVRTFDFPEARGPIPGVPHILGRAVIP